MAAILEIPSKNDQLAAKESISILVKGRKRYMRTSAANISIKIQEDANAVNIPKKAFVLLYEILENMAEGNTVTIIPTSSQLSTQQAADMLNVSRPHIVSLLEKGEIPFNKAGTHRRIELSDLLAYKKTLKQKRSKNLAFLAKQAQELNLGY
jgi:excisionase family DNA binding protein